MLPLGAHWVVFTYETFVSLFVGAPFWAKITKNRECSTGSVTQWVTRLSICSFACTAHSFACSALLASLVRSAALTSLTPSLVGKWMIRWLFFQCFFLFWTIVCLFYLASNAVFFHFTAAELQDCMGILQVPVSKWCFLFLSFLLFLNRRVFSGLQPWFSPLKTRDLVCLSLSMSVCLSVSFSPLETRDLVCLSRCLSVKPF